MTIQCLLRCKLDVTRLHLLSIAFQDDQEVDRCLLGEGEGAIPRQGEPGVHEGEDL